MGWVVTEIDAIIPPLTTGLLVLLGIELWVIYLWTVRLFSLRIAINEGRDASSSSVNTFLIIRPLLTIFSGMFIGSMIVTNNYPVEVYSLGVGLLFASEILGRYVFYAAEEWTQGM